MISGTEHLRAAVIGLGVGEKHIDGYRQDFRCEVVAICDVNPDKLADVSSRHPCIPTTRNPLDILDDPTIDVVSIASYDNAHHEQVVRAAKNGKHIFVEKPLCLHDEEFADIVMAMNERPLLKLSSNLILRKCPRFITLRDRIRVGELGNVYYVEGDYNYGRLHKITEGWRGEIPFYSVAHGGSIHLVDLLLWMTGDRVREVTAMGTNIATRNTPYRYNDTIAALLRFESGAIGKITSNYSCVFPHFHNVTIYGTNATFVQNHSGGAALYQTRDPNVAPSPVTDAYPGAAKGDMIPRFVSAILDGGEPEVTKQEVFDAMAISLAIEKSNQLNKPVEVLYR